MPEPARTARGDHRGTKPQGSSSPRTPGGSGSAIASAQTGAVPASATPESSSRQKSRQREESAMGMNDYRSSLNNASTPRRDCPHASSSGVLGCGPLAPALMD